MSSIPFVGDYYDTLGVERDVSTEEIKKAFRKLARECHPDVAKDDPQAATRFNKLRQAYEILVDPVKRTRYDRSINRKSGSGGGWRPPGGPFGSAADAPGAPQDRYRGRSNDLDLEDIFGDFGGMSDFGFGTAPGKSARPEGKRPSTGPTGSSEPGRDISLQVDVAARVAEVGGTITLHYPRLRRGDDGVSVYRYNELYDLRVSPGTRHGSSLRIEKMGDAGVNGGPYGDLVCDIRVIGGVNVSGVDTSTTWHRGPGKKPEAHKTHGPKVPPKSPPPPPPSAAAASADRDGPEPPRAEAGSEDVRVVNISISEAVLGGRVEVELPSGKVRVSVPPSTSSGARLRLRGKGPEGRDLYVELRIVVPRNLDDESRRLIERFAELNPDTPRD